MIFREWRMNRLRKKVASGNLDARIRAAKELFELGDESVRGILVKALDQEDSCSRAALAFFNTGRMDEICDKLERILLATKRTEVAFAITLFLTQHLEKSGSRQALAVLTAFLSQRKPEDFPLFKAPGSGFQPIAFAEDGESLFHNVRTAVDHATRDTKE